MASLVQTPNQRFTLADWCVTEEKIVETVERIIAVANTIKIIAFGSRARGDFRPESDLDLAERDRAIIIESVRVLREHITQRIAALRG